MKRIIISFILVFSLIVTPLLMESVDAHDSTVDISAVECAVNMVDSHSNQSSNDSLHQAHHCCAHATAIGLNAPVSLYVAASIRNNLPFSAQQFGSVYQPGPLLKPPSHV